MSKAATMEIPINSNGDSRNLAEDDSLEQVSDAWCDFNSFNSDFNVKVLQFTWTHPKDSVFFCLQSCVKMLVTASDILLAVYQVCLVLFRNISH